MILLVSFTDLYIFFQFMMKHSVYICFASSYWVFFSKMNYHGYLTVINWKINIFILWEILGKKKDIMYDLFSNNFPEYFYCLCCYHICTRNLTVKNPFSYLFTWTFFFLCISWNLFGESLRNWILTNILSDILLLWSIVYYSEYIRFFKFANIIENNWWKFAQNVGILCWKWYEVNYLLKV